MENHEIEAWGETFSSLAEAVDDPRCKVSYQTAYARLIRRDVDKFETAEEALTRTRRGRKVEVWGETFYGPEITEDPRCVVSYKLFYSRVSKGWTTEKAASTPPYATLGNTVEVWGQTFPSITKACEDPRCVVPWNVVRQRIYTLGWSPEKALTTPKQVGGASIPVEVWGESFPSVRQAAQDSRCSVAYQTVLQRLERGWPVEKAFNEPPRST